MSEFETGADNFEEAGQHDSRGDSALSMRQPSSANDSYRVAELEIENTRLHRLVAELLIKNQQLRKQS
jgi:hypothetical protein